MQAAEMLMVGITPLSVKALVKTGSDGYKSVAYTKLTAVLVEAIKELKIGNDVLKAQVKAQQDLMASIMVKLETL